MVLGCGLGRAFRIVVVLGGVMLAGCAAESSTGPSTTGSLSGGRCGELKAEASRLEARGVQHKADQAGRGEIKLSAQQKVDVDRYNSILDQYLGGKCHL